MEHWFNKDKQQANDSTLPNIQIVNFGQAVYRLFIDEINIPVSCSRFTKNLLLMFHGKTASKLLDYTFTVKGTIKNHALDQEFI